MIKNYFFLSAGILSLLFAFTHGYYGQLTTLSVTNAAPIDNSTKNAIFYTWHMATAENLVFFIFLSFKTDLSKMKFAVYLIILVLTSRYMVFLGSVIFKDPSQIYNALSELLVLGVFISLMIFGLRSRSLTT